MLEIRQYDENVWEHVDTVRGLVFSSSAFNFDLNNGIFQIKEINGQNRFAYNRAQIRVFPLGGGEESFSTDLALHQRLRELNYTPFQFVIPGPVSIGVDEPLQLDPFTSKISIPKASTAQDGYLDKLDFADFREKFFEIFAGTLRNKDNNLNMLFRFLSQKGLTIELPFITGSPGWNVFRILQPNSNGGALQERFNVNNFGDVWSRNLFCSSKVLIGEGNPVIISFSEFQNSAGVNVLSPLLFNDAATPSGGGGMPEAPFYSTDRATLRRDFRLLCNLDLKRIDLHTFPGFTPINSTSETLIRTILIPANTLDAESAFEFYTRFNFTDAAQTKSLRVRHSTTAGFSTAHTLIGTNNVTAATLFSPFIRTFRLSGGNLTGFGFNVSSANDLAVSGNATGSTTFNPAVDNYIHISGFVANASASITPTLSIIEKIIS